MAATWLAAVGAAACSSDVAGSARGAGGGGGTSASTTSAGGAPATGGGGGGGGSASYPLCVDRDPGAVFTMAFDLAAWDPATTKSTFRVAFEAPCEVSEVSKTGESVMLALSCEHEERGPTPIGATLTLPGDLELPLEAGARVTLAYNGHGAQGELRPAGAFALHAEEGGALLIAGYDVSTSKMLDALWTALSAPLVAKVDEALCPRVELEQLGTYSQRHGVALSEGDKSVTVLDGARGLFEAPAGRFDVVVSLASGQLTGASDFLYRFLVVRKN